jgi:hypothetical protein
MLSSLPKVSENLVLVQATSLSHPFNKANIEFVLFIANYNSYIKIICKNELTVGNSELSITTRPALLGSIVILLNTSGKPADSPALIY